MATLITIRPVVITILSDAKVSAAGAVQGHQLIGFDLPAAWTTSDITLQGSIDGGTTFKVIADSSNTAWKCTAVAQNQSIMFLPALTPVLGYTHLKISSSTDQGANRTVGLILRKLDVSA